MSGFQLELPPKARQSMHLMAICAYERIREIGSPHAAKPVLSPREREVLSWVALGKSATDIATILGISAGTVDQHVRSASLKLGALNRAHAVAIAIKDRHIKI
jgi:LuxR family quorum sensing-dependent transcriptional regulator